MVRSSQQPQQAYFWQRQQQRVALGSVPGLLFVLVGLPPLVAQPQPQPQRASKVWGKPISQTIPIFGAVESAVRKKSSRMVGVQVDGRRAADSADSTTVLLFGRSQRQPSFTRIDGSPSQTLHDIAIIWGREGCLDPSWASTHHISTHPPHSSHSTAETFALAVSTVQYRMGRCGWKCE